jgi:hypothetical protein
MNIAFLRAAALCSALWLSGTWNPVVAAAGVKPAGEDRLNLSLRRLVQAPDATNPWPVAEQQATWEVARTAVVVCDMWDRHWCRGATARVAEMAPRMNQALAALRNRGVLIIHCPSETMGFYTDHPGRKLAQGAPKVDVEAQRGA